MKWGEVRGDGEGRLVKNASTSRTKNPEDQPCERQMPKTGIREI